jgi:hypothetical protein
VLVVHFADAVIILVGTSAFGDTATSRGLPSRLEVVTVVARLLRTIPERRRRREVVDSFRPEIDDLDFASDPREAARVSRDPSVQSARKFETAGKKRLLARISAVDEGLHLKYAESFLVNRLCW